VTAAAVEVKNPASLSHALAHHAKHLEPLVGALALGILTELQPKGWTLKQHKSGPQSFSLSRDLVQYHFRPAIPRDAADNVYREIVVKDAWTHGREVARLRTRPDVLRFVRMVAAQ
jgi:hypothetical protein